MKTAKQAEKAQAVFDKYTEIRDLDLKGRNCNFTVAAGEAKAKEVLKALEGVGFKVVTLDLKPNQTFTVVSTAPKKEHSKAEELQKEKEVKSGK